MNGSEERAPMVVREQSRENPGRSTAGSRTSGVSMGSDHPRSRIPRTVVRNQGHGRAGPERIATTLASSRPI